MPNQRLIFKLDESVVNRIAAGEVLQRPWNAVKELIENAHDAKATRITVTVGDGGLGSLSVADNGTGIQLDDLALLCERFATSKLARFEELSGICTFGFRGEALASISQVARVTVVTRTEGSNCAYKAYYLDGKQSPLPGLDRAEPIGCAGNRGTTISVDGLFYNLPTRKSSFNPDEEYSKILQLCQKYAIHWNSISFSCQKVGSKSPDLVVNEHHPLKLDRIRCIFGTELAKNLIPLHIKSENFEFTGYVSSLSFGCQSSLGKRFDFILFVNERLVECQRMKRAVAAAYEMLLMRHVLPFFFGELTMPGELVDVNVHPTKNQVFFLHEEEIIGKIVQELEAALKSSSYERSFFVPVIQSPVESTENNVSPQPSTNAQSPPSKTVRTDHKDGNLSRFISPVSQPSSQIPMEPSAKRQKQDEINSLESIFNLKQCLKSHLNYLSDSVFVGLIDDEICLFQKGTLLQLLKYRPFFHEYLYFLFLETFGIFESFCELQIETKPNFSDDTIPEMLKEYFGIEWTETNLRIPTVLVDIKLKDAIDLSKLTTSVVNAIDWENEEKSLHQIINCLSSFYTENLAPGYFSNSVFDKMKKCSYSQKMLNSDNIQKLTDLHDLYRVFQRC